MPPLVVPPYTALAAGYDCVMAHVDYDVWAAYAHRLLRDHGDATGTARVLELGCGTGALAVRLQPLGPYPAYTATDRAEAMLREARAKADAWGAPLTVRRADFTALAEAGLPGAPFDAALLLYDGLNYVLDAARLPAVFAGVADVLRPGGLFVVDQTTPANSAAHADAFDDAGRDPVHAADATRAFAYVRHSRYDAEAGLHITTLDLTVDGGRTVREEHVQRVYTPGTLRAVIAAGPLTEEAAYDGFTRDAAHAGSYRVHWVLRREG